MTIYKANDIRGRYPDDLNEDLYKQIGAAIALQCESGETLLVGGDVRTSTPALKDALIGGLLQSGVNVVDLGIGPTPVHYFALRTKPEASGLLIVTASHNPPADNGLKLMLHGQPPTPEQIHRIRADVENGRVRMNRPGIRQELDIVPAYSEWIRNRFKGRGGHPVRVVVDAGNGCWSALAPVLFKQCGFEVIPLYCEFDGRYPNRSPDSSNPANLNALMALVVESRAQLGVAFDGDGDRAAFVMEDGRPVMADEAAYLLADLMLAGTSNESIVYDLKLSRIIQQIAARHTAAAHAERSGHAYIKKRMLDENALFGCEASGHYFYRELHGGDDGLYTALLLANSLSERGDRLTDRQAAIPPHVITPDIRLACGAAEAGAIIDSIARRYPRERVLCLDGVRVDYPQGWALARASITEPKITFRFEADTVENLRVIVADFLSEHPRMAGNVNRQMED